MNALPIVPDFFIQVHIGEETAKQSQISLLQSMIDKRSNYITSLEVMLNQEHRSQQYKDAVRETLGQHRKQQAKDKRSLGLIIKS